MWNPHETKKEEKLSTGLAQQISIKSEKDRCFIKSYISGDICIFQPVILDLLFDAGGQYRCKINRVIIILYE